MSEQSERDTQVCSIDIHDRYIDIAKKIKN